MAARIKKGDTVIVLAGKDKGKRGQVSEVLTKIDKVVVEGVNSVITHQKQTKDSAGGRVPKNAPVHLSNVALLDPKNDVPTRVSFVVKDGKKVRVAKKSGEIIDG
jgi:large subunit ribosomal protein L24